MSELSHKARRRWALIILLVGLPVYIVVAVNVIDLFERPPFLLELAIYVVLGLVWALPFRFIFRGVGKADPDTAENDQRNRPRR
ncbi:DUF2842 domain-containing protein [Alkalilacustris brevis]|uniref:DUF2842 domain-containing protein n=1 Tax=Alkalilacustris brevis TaxID=2026338 RepID=UPI000E0CF338|nr:DUF2842 domain-containing protein [Alkalilacustris brevis]